MAVDFKTLHQTHLGKITDKWQQYLSSYDAILSPYKTRKINLLEIGVQNGGSLEVWSKYFADAQHIIGCDINPKCGELVFEDPRIKVFVGDASKEEVHQAILKTTTNFDIIIDDGSHTSRDIIHNFALYFDNLRDGGVYIIEDLHCSYWQDFGGGLYHPYSSMAFLKNLVDVIHYEHWGLALDNHAVLREFYQHYGSGFSVDLSHIHSVEFINSICVIKKQPPTENELGVRCVSGMRADVCSEEYLPSGQKNKPADQNSTSYKISQTATIENLEKNLDCVSDEILSQQQKIISLQNDVDLSQLALKEKRYQKFKSLWSVNLIKPLVKIEQGLSSANVYRKGFYYLVRDIGSIGKAYQMLRRLRKIHGTRAVKTLLRAKYFAVEDLFDSQQNELSLEEMKRMASVFVRVPLISIVMPVYNTPIKWLKRAIESLQNQVYEHWELCVVDDCSPTDEQRRLIEELAKKDNRIRFVFSDQNMGISGASNVALSMAQGEFVALVDHDDEITPDALFWVVDAINSYSDVDFIYTDECKVDDTADRKLFDFIFKPNWSPEIMLNIMLTGHLTVYKTQLVQELGGFRSEYDFSQDYDLALRAGQKAKHVVHIERILYLWRSIPGSAAIGGKDYARLTNVAALQDYVDRLEIKAKVKALPHANCVEVSVDVNDKVSIVIPSDSYDNLKSAIDEILDKTNYPNYEVVAVCNSPLAIQLEKEYADKNIIFSRYDKKYNFSDKCNQGAEDASGKFVVFYNDDVFPCDESWLSKLLECLQIPGVEAVSPKLLYENGRIQYAGMISGTPGLCGTAYHTYGVEETDQFLSMHRFIRNVSILSGACCAFRREVFLQVGGFDAINTPDGHSDVDLSYKIIEAGYRCVYTPYSVLYHIGNHSWGMKKDKYKADIFCLKRWGKYISEDPYFTDSMKKVIYKDFTFNYKIYAKHIQPNQTYTGKDVLLISHELSATGAPRMLYYAALAIKENGGFPVVVCSQDGVMREEFEKAGIAVIIDESINSGHFLFKGFARNFDVVIVNTIALADVVHYLSEIIDLKIIWWLHEAQALTQQLDQHLSLANRDVRILCVSEYARSFVPPDFQSLVLHNGILDDIEVSFLQREHSKFTFSLLGTIESRKGQDIFFEAISLLPLEVRQDCRFVLAGKLWDWNRLFWESALNFVRDCPEVEYLGLLNHAQIVDLMSNTDVQVCCSRDESFSLVAIEAAMMGRVSLLSKNVGVCEVFAPENSCLVFEPNDPHSLAERMIYAYEHQEEIKVMGARAREVFDRKFTFKHFSSGFLNIINESIF